MATGTRVSYTDSGIVPRGIADAIHMIDWIEAPLLTKFGFSMENKNKLGPTVNWPQTKLEWVEDTMPVVQSTLGEALDNSETAWDVASGEGSYFRQGDVVGVYSTGGQIAEKAVVTSVSTDTLTVQARGYGDTNAASHSSGATIEILTRTMPEASDFTTGYTTTTTQPYNYTQILSEAAKVSGTRSAISMYGIEDEMDYQIGKLFVDNGRAGRLPRMLEKTFFSGERVQRTASVYGTMGGFEIFVTTSTAGADHVTDLNGAPVQRSDIHSIIRAVKDDGGRCDTLITGSWGIEKITAMYEGQMRYTQDTERGGSDIRKILTPHGEVELIYADQCPTDRMYFVDSTRVGWLPLRDFMRKEIKEQGDYFVSDVVGEYTFFVLNAKSHGYIKEMSTSS